jgi:DNA polymerase-1
LRHAVYADSDKYPIAILVKGNSFNVDSIEKTYTIPLERGGIDRSDTILVALEYNDKGKAPVTLIKEQLDILLPGLDAVGTRYLYCADAAYFKTLTKARKAEPNLGYSLPCRIKGYEHMEVILGVNQRALLYNPANEPKLNLSISTLIDVINGTYQGLGHDIIKGAGYPSGAPEIAVALNTLHKWPELSADIETGSLDFDKAGVGTIAFCWSQGEGIAFACDYVPNPNNQIDDQGMYGRLVPNSAIRAEIKKFLLEYKGTLKWHNAPFDLSILIYELWMENLLDTAGLLTGLEVMTQSFHDTKIIAYLATNTTAGNSLSLKDLAHPFAGNWAKDDIKDIRKIPLPELLEYNLIDGLSTNYTFDKYYPVMVADQQKDLYEGLMLPSQKMITQVELTGMPMDPKMIPEAKRRLKKVVDAQKAIFETSPLVAKFNVLLQTQKMKAANAKLKVKQHPLSAFADEKFNPASGPQKVELVYRFLGLPVQHLTKGKQPSTKGKHLATLVNHSTDPEVIKVLNALTVFTTAEKILTSFIPAFEQAIDKGDGVVWLHGSFNLGGTKSGRLSSSDPNMQNIPAGSTYAKIIKACFMAPDGWLFCGADFNSLEDYISALTTRDPNKLKVYEDGYDGHCLRAFSYFPDELPGIVDTVESINSIETLFPEIRQDSKAPTFALTYQGMYITLMKNLGWSEEKAKRIEKNYHDMYAVSDAWVQDKLDEASTTGYVELAFGLRLRTPLLANTIRGHRTTPFEAEAEGRTAGNALGQSYGLLNNRAAVAFMERVWASKYRFDIKPVALIHDAIYLCIRDNSAVVEWVNQELINAMEWQDLPELEHDTVKLGAGLEIFWPTWNDKIAIPNQANQAEIIEVCNAAILERQAA